MSTTYQERSDAKEILSNDSAKTSHSSNAQTIRPKGLTSYLSVEVTASHADILLLICCIISGLVDSTIYNAYGTFVSMQTVINLPLRAFESDSSLLFSLPESQLLTRL